MNNFKELNVWKEAISMASEVYSFCKRLPQEEKFGIISQIQRSSVSVSSNIAEGAGRNNKGEFYHFLGIARGSASETMSLLYLCIEVGFSNESELTDLIDKIDKIQNMIFRLQQSLK
ncbi:four helix bundle protein [Parvicella tangerina]|uniref:Four helix bundle protein n=1 Tax=Parvicella tangerina TaxID=2829795 RepID=A0A916NET6_9FLAO|nr:four helix bundle protein [Parvicella tangerina]CAG5076989.1 hypothetical protein CRYO30217_00264 [Parvicella tangerina]